MKADHGLLTEIILLQFLAMRKTLEANMVMADLFPPGRVLWAVREGDLCPSHRLNRKPSDSSNETGEVPSDDAAEGKVRLFEVLDVEKMFGQMIFARDMLRCVFMPSICILCAVLTLSYHHY